MLSNTRYIQEKNAISDNDIQKVQLKIFTLVIILGFVRTLQLANIYLVEKNTMYIVYTIYALVVSTAFLATLLFRPKYLTLVIHLSIIATLLDTVNKTLFIKEFYITHFQMILMMTVWSFYGLGRRFGFVYSTLFTSIIFIYIFLFGTNFQIFPTKDDPEFYMVWFSFFLNNFLFIWSHYYYQERLQNIILNKRIINKELVKSLKANSRFSETVTNKLKTPLDTIILTSNRLLEKNHSSESRKKLEILKFSSQSLLEIINNILSYNNINNQILEDQPFDLAELLNNIFASFNLKTTEKNIELTLQYPEKLNEVLILSDRNRLMQILYNLIGNAIKFTPSSGKIEVVITEKLLSKKNCIKLNFSIKDSGIGIEADKIDQIFKPFKQADNSITRKYGGTGLGLTIVQKALKNLDSKINLTTKPNVGTTFTFDIVFKTEAKTEILTDIVSI